MTFDPDEDFVAGEEIQIGTDAAVVGVGELSFRVAVPADPPEDLPTRGPSELPPPELRQLTTLPGAGVPEVDVEGDLGEGVFLSTPAPIGDSRMGVQITDANGGLVWWRPAPADGVSVGALEVHELAGEPVLAWFEGTAPFGVGNYQGEWVIVDETYTEVARLEGANGIAADLHDLVITDDDTALWWPISPS